MAAGAFNYGDYFDEEKREVSVAGQRILLKYDHIGYVSAQEFTQKSST